MDLLNRFGGRVAMLGRRGRPAGSTVATYIPFTMGKKWRAEKPSGEVKDSLTTEEEHKEDGWMKPFGEK